MTREERREMEESEGYKPSEHAKDVSISHCPPGGREGDGGEEGTRRGWTEMRQMEEMTEVRRRQNHARQDHARAQHAVGH